ncbi:hypothetical protein TrST_g917 [Triparma strigata]|uniref:J domain-containing protein n=1 Tax=Triparma strigata TaxID=1606541 RepID=A0A9W7BSU2_9STRA|nr:hypothetical protein TrST_g917 [Triparma strigata]
MSRFARALLFVAVAISLGTASAEESSSDDDPKQRIASIELTLTENVDGATPVKASAYVDDGEDYAIGAFRFAEDHSFFHVETVLDVAKKLQVELPETYSTPESLTKCGKKTCSAGKLWKRSDEMRKADMHDAAGADLIRAMFKKGIESDFVAKCEQSLERTFDNIKRQRERERREAEEEAKLEKRRMEEEEAMEAAKERKKVYEADFERFSSALQVQHDGAEATVGPDGSAQVDLTSAVVKEFVEGRWNETIQLIKKIPGREKSVEILLMEARCHEMQGNHNSALSASGYLIQQAINHEKWVTGSPRMMAVTLGANAAMQLGMSDKALKFYQTVLKFDPEQEQARKQYRGLKKVIKLMNQAEEQIQKGYNKAASGLIDDCLSAMRGLDVDSPLFRSKIQLKLCTILSNMDNHEEALSNCDSAVEIRSSSSSVSDSAKKEAYLVRAEALLLDMDFDEAVSDFRSAFDLVPPDSDEKRTLNQKLHSSMQQQDAWNGGKKDHFYNEHRGFPDGKPPERDHIKILQLPVNLEEHDKAVKCKWLKKQFKTLVRKFHPDKYKGNKKRAARKFKEVTDSKEHLSKQWEC